jgi:hypothetical protein
VPFLENKAPPDLKLAKLPLIKSIKMFLFKAIKLFLYLRVRNSITYLTLLHTCEAVSEVSASYNDLVIINSSQECREVSSIIEECGEPEFLFFTFSPKMSSSSSKDLDPLLEV